MDTNFRGTITELKCKLYFLELGYVVSTPETPTRYDFILDTSTQELHQIFKDKLANAEDSYQHFTMVDKDAVLAYYAQEDIKVYKEVLALIDRLEKEGTTNV